MAAATVLTATPIHPEGPRYGATLVFLPGLWAGPGAWRPAASFFAHRGWQGRLLDLRSVTGGVTARGRAVADFIAGLSGPAVLVGHDAGALAAVAAATHGPVAALVLIAPLVPGSPGAHAFTWSWRLGWAAMRRHSVAPPAGRLADLVFAEVPEALRRELAPDDAVTVAEIGRHDRLRIPPSPPATLLIHGDADPVLPVAAARGFAERLGAETHELAGAGHWPIVGPTWRGCVDHAHRWLVQRLGEPLLELYPEAMADRDDADDDAS